MAVEEAATICPGEIYPFYGQDLDAAGTYTAVLPATTGCDTIVTLTLTVTEINTTVTLQDGTLTAAATGALFQWLDCSDSTIIFGANQSSFTPEVSGEYAVAIIQGACVAISDCHFVVLIGTNEPLAGTAWTLQPNPARTTAKVVLQEAISGKARLDIYDAAGRTLRSINVVPGATQIDLDLTGMPAGLLLIRLSDAHGASTKRLIKTEE